MSSSTHLKIFGNQSHFKFSLDASMEQAALSNTKYRTLLEFMRRTELSSRLGRVWRQSAVKRIVKDLYSFV